MQFLNGLAGWIWRAEMIVKITIPLSVFTYKDALKLSQEYPVDVWFDADQKGLVVSGRIQDIIDMQREMKKTGKL